MLSLSFAAWSWKTPSLSPRLQQAANLGDPMAANLLAERFARADAAPDDALRYYRQAAMAGQLPTRYNIGALGTGVEVEKLSMGKKWDSNKIKHLRATRL